MRTTPMFVGDENGLRDYKGQGPTRRAAVPDIDFGRKVADRRHRLQMTQVDLSVCAGIHAVTLSRIEGGVLGVTDKMRSQIEKALDYLELDCDCPAHDFVGRECTCYCVHTV